MANFNTVIVDAINTANNLQDASDYLGNIKYIPVKYTTDQSDLSGSTITLTGTLPDNAKVVAVSLLHTAIASATQVDLGTVAEPDALLNNEDLTSVGTILFPEGATGDKTDGVAYNVGGEKLILTFNGGVLDNDSIEGYILISTDQ